MGIGTLTPNGADTRKDTDTPAQDAQTLTPAQERIERARKAAEAAQAAAPTQSPRERFKLAKDTDWHDLPTGGYVGLVVNEQGIEYAVEVTSQDKVRRTGVSVLAIGALQDAGYV